MSRRTLARNLSRQDTNFQAIRFSVIEEVAKQALLQTNSSIVDIALQLGFSEASGFDHCFKRLTGYTPRQYRKDQR
jgi:AraC-like DNA-binding protein